MMVKRSNESSSMCSIWCFPPFFRFLSQQNASTPMYNLPRDSTSPAKSWNLTRTTQFKDPGDIIISDPAVLKVRNLQNTYESNFMLLHEIDESRLFIYHSEPLRRRLRRNFFPQSLEDFLLRKLCTLSENKYSQKDSEVDRVFALALKEFKCNLISTYCTAPLDTQKLCLRWVWNAEY